MSDSTYDNRSNNNNLIDIVDAEWAADTLSDDEIELPIDADPIPDEADIDQEMSEFKQKEEEKWNDLALDTFERENSRASCQTVARKIVSFCVWVGMPTNPYIESWNCLQCPLLMTCGYRFGITCSCCRAFTRVG